MQMPPSLLWELSAYYIYKVTIPIPNLRVHTCMKCIAWLWKTELFYISTSFQTKIFVAKLFHRLPIFNNHKYFF